MYDWSVCIAKCGFGCIFVCVAHHVCIWPYLCSWLRVFGPSVSRLTGKFQSQGDSAHRRRSSPIALVPCQCLSPFVPSFIAAQPRHSVLSNQFLPPHHRCHVHLSKHFPSSVMFFGVGKLMHAQRQLAPPLYKRPFSRTCRAWLGARSTRRL